MSERIVHDHVASHHAASHCVVELERTGGQVPTHRPHVIVDARTLAADEREVLMRLIASIDLTRCVPTTPRPPAPDAFSYRLTLHVGAAPIALSFSDGDGHAPALDALVAWMRTHPASAL